jgi:endoglucanase
VSPEPDPIGLSVTDRTSRSLRVEWEAVNGAEAVAVSIGPEPAAQRGDPLPLAEPVATLDGDATSYRVEGLAAGVHVFVHVAIETAEGAQVSHVHGRTRGGPRATLQGPLREVHGLGPDVLRVTLTGGDPSVWERSQWQITRSDGTALEVTSVDRKSVPVGAPEYETGWGGAYDNEAITVDHRIFLELAEPVGPRAMLHIEGPGGVSFTLPFSDRYLATPSVQLNQVGYHPGAQERWAYLSGWKGDGGDLDLTDMPSHAEVLAEPAHDFKPRTPVMEVPVELRRRNDRNAGTTVHQIDLSEVPAREGVRYRIRIPGVGVSWPTAVSHEAVFKAYYVVLRGLFHNRWGGDLAPEYTEWSRPPDHPTVYTGDRTDFMSMYDESQPKTGERPLQGGYHDAGDFDQRPMHTVVPRSLMRAYEVNRDAFTDGQLTLPESGNGIPDLLDEALWGVRAWEQLQEPSGGVRMGVESHRHPWGFYLAHEDPLPYWTYAVNEHVTARAAGLFAQAARLVEPFDAERAQSLEQRAVDAYRYAREHGAKYAYMLYAAGELYRHTGEARYAERFEAAWDAMGSAGAFSNYSDENLYMGDYQNDMDPGRSARATSDFLLGYLGAEGAAERIRQRTERRLPPHAEDVLEHIASSHAHRNPRPQGHPIGWGQATTTARYMGPVLAMLQRGGLGPNERQNYLDALSMAADYVLGANPQGFVYVTGLGTRRVREPLHLDSLVFAKRGLGPVPGIPVYGPSESIRQRWNETAVSKFHPSAQDFPRGRRYGDTRLFVRTNEFSVWEVQAPMAELFAVLLSEPMQPPDSWLPGGEDHRSPLP